MLAFTLAYWEQSIIKTVAVLTIFTVGAILLGYTFLMKMMSHMQSRLGPMESGGFHGWFQNLGDAVKFIQKEDIIPRDADKWVFSLAPYVVMMSTFLLFLVIPMGPDLVVSGINRGANMGEDVFYSGTVGGAREARAAADHAAVRRWRQWWR